MKRDARRHALSVIVLGGFVFLAFGSSGAEQGTGVSQPTPQSSVPVAPSVPPTPAPAPEPEPTLSIGDSFRVGSFSYVINRVEVTSRIGRNRYTREEPSAGAVFLVVRFSETNEGSETHTGAGSPIRFRDAQGRTYQPSSRAETAIAMSERQELLPQLQPGIAHQAATAFEIPESSASGVGTLVVSERGFWGSQTAEVQFGFRD